MFPRSVLRFINKTVKTDQTVHRRHGSHIAFIGTGNMGSRMATNLAKKGETVRIYDVLSSNTQSVKGAQICKSPHEAVEDAKLTITMLPSGDIVKETILGADGILKSASKGSVIIDSSTIQPKIAQEISQTLKKHDIEFLDAPVSGGITGAEAGTLTFMVGGDKDILSSIEPVLLKMGANVHHCGKPGAGQIAKLCNNLILGVTMIATAEGMNLGIKLGVDPKILASIINVSTGRSWSSSAYNPVPGVVPNVPSNNDYQGGFAVKLIAKDLGLAEDVAVTCEAPVPLAAAAHQLYRALIVNGFGNKDFAYVYQFLKGIDQ